MKVVLNGAKFGSRRALHAFFKRELSLPDWYGGNLDALHDCLTDLHEPTEIVLQNMEMLAEQLGFYANSLQLVLRRAAQENPHLTVTIE